MKKVLLTLALAAACAFCASAQNSKDLVYQADSLGVLEDQSLAGASIFNSMPKEVTVHQSGAVKAAAADQISRNAGRQMTGFRIRVFYDNAQSARNASESVYKAMQAKYPRMTVDRSFANQYFMVTIGRFRTRIDAVKVLREIQGSYPDATIIKERFKYPEF